MLYISGDTHGCVSDRIYQNNLKKNDELILLGDVGLNFYLDETQEKEKEWVSESGVTVYCVRGNHEARPEDLPQMEKVFNEHIKNYIYQEPLYPNIKYLIDGLIYEFDGYKCLVIGGAYSIDKNYRLAHKTKSGWCGWWENEMLSPQEQEKILFETKNAKVDFIFSHTCPIEYQPIDLFIPRSNTVASWYSEDTTMEEFLSKIAKQVNWKIWCFGHFHQDRTQAERVELFYQEVKPLKDIYDNWFTSEAFVIRR